MSASTRVSLVSWEGGSHAVWFMFPLGLPGARSMVQALWIPFEKKTENKNKKTINYHISIHIHRCGKDFIEYSTIQYSTVQYNIIQYNKENTRNINMRRYIS